MTKWPKGWLNPLIDLGDARSGAVQILDALHKVGALKEPSKPREYWMCARCWWVKGTKGQPCHCSREGKMIHVREVLSDD